MVRLILHDFKLPEEGDEYFQQDEGGSLSKILIQVWKKQSEQCLKYWKDVDRYIIQLKHTRKLEKYFTIPKDYVDDDLVVWHLLPIVRDQKVFEQISQRLRDKFEIALRAVSYFGFFYQFLNNELRNNKRICLASVGNYPKSYHWFSEELQNDRNIVMRALKSKLVFKIPNQFNNYKQVVKLYVKNCKLSTLVDELASDIINDREVAIEAIKKCPKSVGYLSQELQHDHSFIIKAVKCNIFSFSEFPKSIRENRQFVKQLIEMKLPLFLLSDEFRNDAEIVKLCVKQNFTDVQYANCSIQSKEFFMDFLKDNYATWDLFKYVPQHVLSDMEFVKLAISKNEYLYRSLKDEQKTREITEFYLSQKSLYCIANDLPKELMCDRDLVLECIKTSRYIYQIPPMYRKDKELIKVSLKIVCDAYKNCISSISLHSFIDSSLMKDQQFIKDLIEEIPILASLIHL